MSQASPPAIVITPSVAADFYAYVQRHCSLPMISKESDETRKIQETGNGAPEAPMAVSSGIPLATLPRERAQSPPAPELGLHEHLRAANIPLSSTETDGRVLHSDFDSTGIMSPSTPGDTVGTPVAEKNSLFPSMKAGSKSISEFSPTPSQPNLQTRIWKNTSTHPIEPTVRLVVISRGFKPTQKIWKPKEGLENQSLEQLKQEIPLDLSPDFCGFKFTFAGLGLRTVYRVQDGDEYEFRHMKLEIDLTMQDWIENSEGNGADVVCQLRIEELRASMSKTHESTA